MRPKAKVVELAAWIRGAAALVSVATCACAANDRVLPFHGDGGVHDAASAPADASPVLDAQGPMRDAGGRGDASEAGSIDGQAAARAKDPDCDMTGLWMAKQLTRSEALALGQFANYWYFFEFRQDGEDVTVVSQFDCDIHVEGSVTVTLTTGTRRALTEHNSQVGRRGTMRKTAGDRCEFALERFWSVRGAEEARFLPSSRASTETVASLRASLPLPTVQTPTGAEDWEADGQLGIAWQITGIATGTRNTVQRDVTEWFTDATHTIAPAADFASNLSVRSRFDNDENVIHASSSLVGSLATADQTAEHRVTLSFLGRDASDPRARAVLSADKIETCARILTALPFENGL